MSTNLKIAAGILALSALAGGAGFASGRAAAPETPDNRTSCTAALGHAERIIELQSEGFREASNGVTASALNDYAGVRRATDNINALAPQVRSERDQYDIAAEACRGGGDR